MNVVLTIRPPFDRLPMRKFRILVQINMSKSIVEEEWKCIRNKSKYLQRRRKRKYSTVMKSEN